MPFKASIDLGGARGVMMYVFVLFSCIGYLADLTRAYNEIDGIPAAVNPMLYETLYDWNFDGVVMADDLCKLGIRIGVCELTF